MTEKMFCDNVHWQAFTDSVRRLKNSDVYHISLVYLLTLDTVCRQHIDDCFDFDNDSVKLDVIKKSWQTSTS